MLNLQHKNSAKTEHLLFILLYIWETKTWV